MNLPKAIKPFLSWAFLTCLALGSLVAGSAKANTVYTYTGNQFNQFGGPAACPPECNLSGFFTLAAPLLINLTSASFVPLTFSFTDGITTFTETTATSFDFVGVGTDSAGNIVSWNIDFNGTSCSVGNCFFSSTNPPGCTGCSVIDGSFSSPGGVPTQFAEIKNAPGTWTMSTVPEPGTLVLFGSGLISVMGFARRKIFQA
jgi:hypothetical protein